MANYVTDNEKIEMLKAQIIKALETYKHFASRCTSDLDNVEDFSTFAQILAEESVEYKRDLRNLLRKHPNWNEKLDAVVVKGRREEKPDYDTVRYLFRKIYPMQIPEKGLSCYALDNFVWYLAGESIFPETVEELNAIDKNIYAEGKRRSRVAAALFRALGYTENREFNMAFAELADAINVKPTDFDWLISVNPAHQVTMSNPNCDIRGQMLVSCHSLTSDYENCRSGAIGYARDDVSIICFSVEDYTNDELLYSRKTIRQMFYYQPYNGLLLQSRLYDASGGLHTKDSDRMKLYREITQKVLSECEDEPNLWQTKEYEDFPGSIDVADEFTGYPDWLHGFDSRVSTRKGKTDFVKFTVGKAGRCLSCGDVTSRYDTLLCGDCGGTKCEDCGQVTRESISVYDEYGNRIEVCEDCLRDNYYYCECCEEYHHDDNVTFVPSADRYVCDACLNEHYVYCHICDEYHHEDNMTYIASERRSVCDECLDAHYTFCNYCEDWEPNEDVRYVESIEEYVCKYCIDNNFDHCEDCGGLFPINSMQCIDGKYYCSDCAEERKEAM